MQYCFLVPHFNHFQQFEFFLPKLASVGLPIVVIDDGSSESELGNLRLLVAEYSGVSLIELGLNRGKGAAVMVGFNVAAANGYSHAIQVDADGQHNLGDVDKLLEASKALPSAIISGRPTFGKDAPKVRVYGRRVTDIWTALETLSFEIKDALCGFRIYPLAVTAGITDRFHIGVRMEFDTDILVKASWTGVPIRFVDTSVVYIEGGKSHFHYLRDNLRLIGLHIRLIGGMLVRLPWLISSRLATRQR